MRRRLFGPIQLRLLLAFLVVALGGLGVFAALTLVAAEGDVSSLVRQQQERTVAAVARAAADSYTQNGSWVGHELTAAKALASDGGAGLSVSDSSGRTVARTPSPNPVPAGHSPTLRTSPVVVDGKRVGTVGLSFPLPVLPRQRQLATELARTVALAAGLSALLALLAAILVSRRITRPVAALTDAARSMEAGNREARVGDRTGPGELAELATAFDSMADAVEREDALRRSLVADVAHELRTPITILQASTEAVLDGVVAASPEQLSSFRDEVLRLRRMVEDLETLASAEAAGLRLDRRSVDLAELAGEVAEGFRPNFAASGVGLVTRLDRATVAGDPDRLAQVMTNLLTNAMKFTPAGGRVTVATGSADHGSSARLEVTDTGIGIPPDELPRVFERFWRGRRAGRVAGSGIGLAVVTELVRAHGGSIEARSDPGLGTSFVVTLPLVSSSQPVP